MLVDLKMEIIAVIVLIIWNIIVFAVYGLDKQKAQQRKRRISEEMLLLSAALMGGIGALLGMHVFRHKTKHLKFKISVPLLIVLNIAVVCVYLYFK